MKQQDMLSLKVLCQRICLGESGLKKIEDKMKTELSTYNTINNYAKILQSRTLTAECKYKRQKDVCTRNSLFLKK